LWTKNIRLCCPGALFVAAAILVGCGDDCLFAFFLQDKHCEVSLVKGAASAAAAKATIRAMSKNAQTTLNGLALPADEDRYVTLEQEIVLEESYRKKVGRGNMMQMQSKKNALMFCVRLRHRLSTSFDSCTGRCSIWTVWSLGLAACFACT